MLAVNSAIRSRPCAKNEAARPKTSKKIPQWTHGRTYIDIKESGKGCCNRHLIPEI
jgi:hypothetical protein